MNALVAVLHFVALGALGFGLAALCTRRSDGTPRGGLFLLSLAPGFAFVINGCVAFARLYTGAFAVGTTTCAYVVLAAAVCLLCARRGAFPRQWCARTGPWSPIVRRIAIVGGIMCAVVWTASIVNEPEGGSDAWQNWNLKARFLWSAGAQWRALFGPDVAVWNPNYPLLLPLNTAEGFTLAGDDSCLVPIAIATCFALALALLLLSACTELGANAPTALCLLLVTPCFLPFATRQYADVEMSYFFLAGSVALFFALRDAHVGDFFLAGVWASAAAFTKNEGVPFALGIGATALLSTVVACARARHARPALRAIACAAGLATVGWAWVLFNLRIAPQALAVGRGTVASLVLPPDWPARAGKTFLWIAEALAKPSMWALLPIACAAAWFGTRAPRSRERSAAGFAVVPLLLVLGAYCAFAVQSSEDAEWLVTGSVGRVLFQLWPGFLFLAAARTMARSDAGASPERGFSTDTGGSA